MKKLLFVFAALLIGLTACEKNQYTDGTYMATFDAVDGHGWRAFVEITIADDMITVADFDYYNATNDTLKSEDAGYNARMLAIKGITNPETYCPQIEAALVDAVIVPEFVEIDNVTGATHSVENANELAAAALESALEGGGDVTLPQHTD